MPIQTFEEKIKAWAFPLVFGIASYFMYGTMEEQKVTNAKIDILLDRTARLEEKILGHEKLFDIYKHPRTAVFHTKLKLYYEKTKKLRYINKKFQYI